MCHCSCTKTRAPQNSDFRLIWMQTVCPRQQFAIEYLRVRMSRSKDYMNYYDYEARIVSEYSTNVFLQHKMHSTRTQEKGSRVAVLHQALKNWNPVNFFFWAPGYLVCWPAEPLAWRGRTSLIWVLRDKKVKWPCEHVLHPRPRTHRWNPNQLKLLECSGVSVKRSECDSSSLRRHSGSTPPPRRLPRTVKDKHSDKQKNVITLRSHHAVHCRGGASQSGRVGLGIVGTKRLRRGGRRFQCRHIAGTQIGCMGPQEGLIRLIFIEKGD